MVRMLLEVTRPPQDRTPVDTNRDLNKDRSERRWRKPVLTHISGKPADTR